MRNYKKLYFDDITQQSTMINKSKVGGGSGGVVNSLCVFSGSVKKRGGI